MWGEETRGELRRMWPDIEYQTLRPEYTLGR